MTINILGYSIVFSFKCRFKVYKNKTLSYTYNDYIELYKEAQKCKS